MAHKPMDIAKARVLISNDDGIDAPGIKLLERIVRPLAAEVWVVAPETEQSGAAHSLTLHHPLRMRRASKWRYAVDGTPTDSVLLGINELMKEHRPDIVLSGINRGGNLGEDVTYSGTVAAAMEATLLGLPAIALSLVIEAGGSPKWATARHWVPKVLKCLMATSWPANILLNVNIPDVAAGAITGMEVCCQGRRKIGSDLTTRLDPRGRAYYWIGPQREEDRYQKGTDLQAVGRGAISVTPLNMDLTHKPTLSTLRRSLG